MTLTASKFFSLPSDQITADIEAAFFLSLKTHNRTFKTTRSGRFSRIDEQMIEILKQSRTRIRDVLDVGVSSGITTIELDRALRAAGYTPRIVATDVVIDAFIVPVFPGCRALVDPCGNILQYELFDTAVRPWRRRLDWIDGMILIRHMLNRICGPRAMRSLAERNGVRHVALISPQVSHRSSVRIVRDDILVPNPQFAGRFDLLRAANIVNRGYFSDDDIQRILANFRSYLAGSGACLLIIRTHGRLENHGTLFRLTQDGRLGVVARFGKGSEIENLVHEQDSYESGALSLAPPLGMKKAAQRHRGRGLLGSLANRRREDRARSAATETASSARD
jgi:hypothetical protein